MSSEPPRNPSESDERQVRPGQPAGGGVRNEPPGRVHQQPVEVKNRIQVGPILAGVVTAIAVLIVLTVLGLAVGATALEPTDPGETMGTAAAIWGAVSAILAFFAGGFIAAKTAAVAGMGSGLVSGFITGATILLLALWMVGTGVGGLLGTVGANIDEIVGLAEETTVQQEDVEEAAEEVDAQEAAQQAFDVAEDGAWWTLLGLLLALGAATLGGLVGHNQREDVVPPAV